MKSLKNFQTALVAALFLTLTCSHESGSNSIDGNSIDHSENEPSAEEANDDNEESDGDSDMEDIVLDPCDFAEDYTAKRESFAANLGLTLGKAAETAYDQTTNKLYIIDKITDIIYSFDFNSKSYELVLNENTITKEVLPTDERISLDDSNIPYNSKLTPLDLNIDVESRKLFWRQGVVAEKKPATALFSLDMDSTHSAIQYHGVFYTPDQPEGVYDMTVGRRCTELRFDVGSKTFHARCNIIRPVSQYQEVNNGVFTLEDSRVELSRTYGGDNRFRDWLIAYYPIADLQLKLMNSYGDWDRQKQYTIFKADQVHADFDLENVEETNPVLSSIQPLYRPVDNKLYFSTLDILDPTEDSTVGDSESIDHEIAYFRMNTDGETEELQSCFSPMNFRREEVSAGYYKIVTSTLKYLDGLDMFVSEEGIAFDPENEKRIKLF